MKRVTDPDLIDKILAGDEGDAPVRGGLSADFPYRTGPPEPVGVGGPSGGFHPDYEPMYSAFDIIQGRGAPPGRRNMPDYRAANAFAQGITARQAGTNLGAPPNLYMEAAESALYAAGMAPGIAGMAGAAGLAIPGWLAGAAALGAYEGMAPAESPLERLKNVGLGAGTGLALAGLHKVPGMGRLTGNIGGRLAADTGVFGGLHAGQAALAGEDVDLLRSLVHGGAAAVAFTGMGAGGAGVDPRRMPDRVRPLLPPEMGVRRAAVPPEAAKRVLSSKLDAELPRPAGRPQIAPESTQIPADAVGGKPKIVAEPAREGRDAGAGSKERAWLELTEPHPDVPAEIVMSSYLRNNIDMKTYVKRLAEVGGKSTGAVGPRGLAVARGQIKAERKAKRAKWTAENKTRKAAEKTPKPKPDSLIGPIKEKQVFARAIANSVSDPVKRQVDSGRVGDRSISQWIDKRRTIIEASGGDATAGGARNPIVRATQRLGEFSELVREKMGIEMATDARVMLEANSIKPGSPESSAVGRLADIFPRGADPAKFFAGEGRHILESLPEGSRAEVAEAATRLRDLFAEHRGWRDMMNREWVGGGFEGLERYFPKQEKKARPLKITPAKSINPTRWSPRLEQETRPLEYRVRNPKASGPLKARSPFEKYRTEKGYEREFDVYKVLDTYIADTARKINYQPAVSAGHGVSGYIKSAAATMVKDAKADLKAAKKSGDRDMVAEAEVALEAASEKAEGMKRSAEAINGVMQASYNNIRYGKINLVFEGARKYRAGQALYKGSAIRKRIFNMAKYKMNIPFIILRQWSSTGQALGFPDVTPGDIQMAALRTLNPLRDSSSLNLSNYVGHTKAGGSGAMSREGMGPGVDARVRRPGTWRIIDAKTDAPTNWMEAMTGKFSAELADIVGRRAGLTGRALTDFRGDVTARMQSEYHYESRAEALRNPVINAAFPAQSYSLEFGNNLRTATGVQRAKLLAGATIANLVYVYANSYYAGKTDAAGEFALELGLATLESAVPYSDLFTGRGPSKGRSFHASSIEGFGQFAEYVEKAVAADDPDDKIMYWERAASQLMKDWVPAGGQISRAMSADAFRRRGIISDDELAQASVLGWWTVPGGRNYLLKITGNSDKIEGQGGGYWEPPGDDGGYWEDQ